MTDLESTLLTTARRREIWADVEAKRHAIALDQVQRAIASLKAKGLIYCSTKAQRNYFGSGFAGYRSYGPVVK